MENFFKIICFTFFILALQFKCEAQKKEMSSNQFQYGLISHFAEARISSIYQNRADYSSSNKKSYGAFFAYEHPSKSDFNLNNEVQFLASKYIANGIKNDAPFVQEEAKFELFCPFLFSYKLNQSEKIKYKFSTGLNFKFEVHSNTEFEITKNFNLSYMGRISCIINTGDFDLIPFLGAQKDFFDMNSGIPFASERIFSKLHFTYFSIGMGAASF